MSKKNPNIFTYFSKGFSLVEILVYVGLASIIFLVITLSIFSLNSSNLRVKVNRETLENARRALDIITYEIRGAKSIYTPTSNLNQLSLEISKYLPEGENSSFIDFFLCDSRLCMKKESQEPVFLTSDTVEVNQLQFAQAFVNNMPSLKIDIIVDYKNPSNNPEQNSSVNLSSIVSLRSY